MEFYSSKEWLDAPKASPGGQKALHWMMEQAEIPAGKYILDLCCGRGESLRYLAEKGYRVIGMDRSKEAIEMARNDGNSRGLKYELRIGDAREPDLSDNAMDGVLCQCSLSLFGDEISSVLKQIHRILRPDGCLLLADLYWDGKNLMQWQKELTDQGFALEKQKDISKEIQDYCMEYIWTTGKPFPACAHGIGKKVKPEELGYFLSVWRCANEHRNKDYRTGTTRI